MTYEFISSERYTDTSTKLTFMLNGRQTIVVRPDKPANGNPTVWRTEFFGAFDAVDRAMLERGWFIVYHRVSDMYGCPESLVMMREFYDFMEQTFNLSKKPVLFGFSRGALYAVNYAAKYQDSVGAMYLDAPCLTNHYWPGSDKYDGTAEQMLLFKWLGITKAEVATYPGYPKDRAHLVKDIPIIIVQGDADVECVWEEHGKYFVDKLEAAGGKAEIIFKPGCGHHPHSLDDPTPVVEFIEKNYEA